MITQEINDALIPNAFLLISAVARAAIADAMTGEATAQAWLDLVCPDWRKRYHPPPATWAIDLDSLEPPAPICERCGEKYERRSWTQKYCAECQTAAKKEVQRQRYKKKVTQVKPTPVVIVSPPSTSVSSVRKELV